MSDRKSSADLGPNLEAVLFGFPFPDRDWEEDALAVETRIAQAEHGESEAGWLAPPLPSEPGELDAPPSATQTPLANSGVRTQSLAAMARRSVENKQAAEREMARASLALAAQQRPNAEEVLAMREAMSSRLPPAPVATLPDAAQAREPMRVASSPPIAMLPRSANAWPKIALTGFVMALAAGALFWFKQPTPTPLVTAVLSPPEVLGKSGDVPSGASSAPALQGVPNGIDPSTLPAIGAAEPAQAAHAATIARSAPAMVASTAHGEEKIVLQDDPGAAPVADAAAERPVAKTLPPDPALRPADSTGGSVPAKPSTGAVQAALGAVMSGARHCVAGDDGPSSAIIVFASDGHVQSVAVSGPAAGKSAGSCIEAQLGRAHVQPFALPNFSVNATVRPD